MCVLGVLCVVFRSVLVFCFLRVFGAGWGWFGGVVSLGVWCCFVFCFCCAVGVVWVWVCYSVCCRYVLVCLFSFVWIRAFFVFVSVVGVGFCPRVCCLVVFYVMLLSYASCSFWSFSVWFVVFLCLFFVLCVLLFVLCFVFV